MDAIELHKQFRQLFRGPAEAANEANIARDCQLVQSYNSFAKFDAHYPTITDKARLVIETEQAMSGCDEGVEEAMCLAEDNNIGHHTEEGVLVFTNRALPRSDDQLDDLTL